MLRDVHRFGVLLRHLCRTVRTETVKDRLGQNSLFEDNAEYGLGIATGIKQIRARVKELLSELASLNISKELKDTISAWIENMENSDVTRKMSDDLAKALKAEKVSGGREKELIDVDCQAPAFPLQSRQQQRSRKAGRPAANNRWCQGSCAPFSFHV